MMNERQRTSLYSSFIIHHSFAPSLTVGLLPLERIVLWARACEAHEADDGAQRAERDEEVEEGGHADYVLYVPLVHAVDGEDEPLHVVEQEADGGDCEPARRVAEGARARKPEHGGDQPAEAAEAEQPQGHP